ncbi:MAG: ubiquitin-like protein [Candidatus Lokiarchaeota archaeon]
MVDYRFRLTGIPPEQAIKHIEIDPNNPVFQIKRAVQREYKINPILAIQFIYKGKVIPDQLSFSKVGVHPKKDVITVMATQAGGFILDFLFKNPYKTKLDHHFSFI